jgi:CRP/FNR family transcriptional regulator
MTTSGSFSGCTIPQRESRCFDKLTEDEQKELDRRSVFVTYSKGEMICKQGSMASHVMFVKRGLVKVFLENGPNLLVLKIIPDGNLLGLSAVRPDNQKFQYSAIAYIDSDIMQIDIAFFNQLLLNNSGFAKEIIDLMGSNSAQINGRFFCLTFKQSYGRLADIILCLSERIFKKHEFVLPLSRKEIAELSGLSPETVVRHLKKFNDEGLIRLEGRYFKVLDFDKLKQISEKG